MKCYDRLPAELERSFAFTRSTAVFSAGISTLKSKHKSLLTSPPSHFNLGIEKFKYTERIRKKKLPFRESIVFW